MKNASNYEPESITQATNIFRICNNLDNKNYNSPKANCAYVNKHIHLLVLNLINFQSLPLIL